MKLEEIIALEKQYYSPVFARAPVCFTRGEDVYLFDTEGKQYTDFLSGIATCCLGYSDERFKQALHEAVDSLLHTSNIFYIEKQAKAAKLLCEAAGMDNVFFSNSGAEAVEGALKLVRKYHYSSGKPRAQFVTMQGSFHGRTLATLAATGQSKFHEPYKPLVPSFSYAPPNDTAALEALVTDETAAVIAEPIIGEGGILPLTAEYWQGIRRVCDAHGALMIADEIQTGMGRTGEFIASPALGALPDVLILAKSLGNGVPVGAFLARGKAAHAFTAGDHGSTFAGNHLASTAALYVTEKLTQSDLLGNVRMMGAHFMEKLQSIKAAYPAVKEVRGRGLMLGIALDEAAPAKDVQKSLLGRGYITATAGGNLVRFLPPYTIRKEHIDALCAALEEILAQMRKEGAVQK
jgi:acetylornithine aminotransferase/acetylornithine/N-succinyldiaminopimelate aminotransferase